MKTVWKYEVPLDDEWHDMPFSPNRIVHVGAQSAAVVVWAERFDTDDDPLREPTCCPLKVFGTGSTIPAGCEHVGSVIVGAFVWHVYRDIRRSKWTPGMGDDD